ncbi:DUF6241 domain-containing protein [Bacillus salipaludis]|uniref:DUF6241 domain-containing protein n=1 Tax=Bacillus salipaludis TaxID=2547811 RepID=A0AA90R201_9BACI|nr:DUF6241 domain-containing protein [Bacillus salipaludis]MDQ6600549.1 DUF6241 domain-containing protein [Bacillus salipaludis]
MKKGLSLTTTMILAFLFIGGIAVYKVMNNASEFERKHTVETTAVAKKDAAKEKKEQTGYIGGVQYDIKLDKSSSQEAVIEVMHKMTHQKVKAKEKWGAVPMIPDTINQVYNIVKNSDFELKSDLLAILEKWKVGNFEEIAEDHNYFWQQQGGTVGKAYGTMTKAEEKTFIANNFGDELAKQDSPQP